jgi:hypothetical protein
MKTITGLLLCGASVGVMALQPVVFGQDAQQPQVTIEQRVRSLEQSLSNLATQVRLRTDVVVGPEDRTSRDLNLDARLDEIERQMQQFNNSVLDLQRQVSDAMRASSQAQNDAMLAQQIARDAQSRVN